MAQGHELNLTFTAPGPVARRFFESRAQVAAIMGPQGSAKTSTVFWRFMRIAMEQAPHPVTQRREFTLTTLRDTYVNAWKTTIPTWLDWFPDTLGDWSGSKDRPAKHVISFHHPRNDGTIVQFTHDFLAVEDIGGPEALELFFRGLNFTGLFMNEADLQSYDILQHGLGRAGRRPKRDNAVGFMGATWRGVALDFNAPDTDNWTYSTFVENLPEGWEFYRQPSGLSAQAENLHNLVPGYYQQQLTNKKWWIRRFIENEFGYSRSGKPVYEEEYSDQEHVAAADLVFDPRFSLVVGMDAGLTPAAVLGQQDAHGRWNILDELVIAHGQMGAKAFGKELAKLLEQRYANAEAIALWGDPAAAAGEKADDEQVWLNIVGKKLGKKIKPAPTNLLTPRLAAVQGVLERRGGFTLSPRCRVLRKGFNSGYRYRRIKVSGTERYTEEPEKNEWSHVHDALQYLLLGGGEYAEVMDRLRKRDREQRARRQAQQPATDTAWHNDPTTY